MSLSKRVNDQLANAKTKLERAQKHAEDRKLSSQKTIERLQREYDEMVVERRENDKQIEEVREEANQLEAQVNLSIYIIILPTDIYTLH